MTRKFSVALKLIVQVCLSRQLRKRTQLNERTEECNSSRVLSFRVFFTARVTSGYPRWAKSWSALPQRGYIRPAIGVWSERGGLWGSGAGCISATDPEALILEDPCRTVQPQVWRRRAPFRLNF